MRDPELDDKLGVGGSSSTEQTPFTGGLYIIGLNEDQVKEAGEFMNDFYQKMREKYKGRQITRNASTMLQGAVFALGTKEIGNVEWKEHCASSLREVVHEWNGPENLGSDFVKLYKNNSAEKKLTSEEAEIFKEFRSRYQYFSGIDHHEASGVLGSLKAILKDENLKLEDCYEDKIFIEQVKNFFSNIFSIIEFSKPEKDGSD